MTKLFIFFFCVFLLSCSDKENKPSFSGPVAAADALSTFQVADGFKIEMVASEPLITDPVDMEIDENGTTYVVEMHGYPLDKSGSGNIIILKDTDADGKFDKRTVFKSGLMLPNSIMRWKKGVLVTDSPNLIYLEDTDGDDQANITDTIITGFALTNPQHNANNPIYGLDNWIYVAHESSVGTREYKDEFGDEGRQIMYYHDTNGVRLPKNAGGRSVRLRPDFKQLEMLSSACQFGHTFDEWGRRFNCSNSNQGFQEVVPSRYFERNPAAFVSDATQSMSDHLDAAEVFPTTLHPDRQILTDAGVLTSACGLTTYMGDAFPEPYNHNVTFVAEPVSNLVHADVLRDSAASFVASRVLQHKEFLSSTDAWSRPVNFYVGPDGALYVLDYYRKVIESPEWMSDEAIKAGGLYDGSDKGRIYRITPTSAKAADWMKGVSLGKSSSHDLVKNLENKNYWWRINAQRLLVDKGDESVVPALSALLKDGSPLGKLHALWTLEGLNAIEIPQLIALLSESEAGLRENAIQVAERYLNKSPELVKALIEKQNDPNAKVRFQLLLTLGYIQTPEAAKATNNILFKDIGDKWVQVAALSARSLKTTLLLAELLKKADAKQFSPLLERLSIMAGSSGADNEVHQFLNAYLKNGDVSIIDGLSEGLSNREKPFVLTAAEQSNLLKNYFETTSSDQSQAILRVFRARKPTGGTLQSAIAKASVTMKDSSADYRRRAAAIRLLQLGDVSKYTDDLKKLIDPKEETIIQIAALQTLSKVKGPVVSEYAIQKWSVLTPEIRTEAVNTFLDDSARTSLLMNALEKNIINPGSVSFGTSVHLMQNDDSSLRIRARNIFTKTERERKKVNQEYQAALGLTGDVKRGREVFVQNCAICHQVRGKIGVAIGPDLGTVHNWIREDLIANIIDPNLGIASGYDTWKAVLNSGESVVGLIVAETPAAITFKANNMADRTVSRQDITSLNALNASLMPTGLEKNISMQQMADLMQFLRGND